MFEDIFLCKNTVFLTPALTGGGYPTPRASSQITEKRRGAAPPYLTHLIPYQFRMGQQNFEVRSCRVTELFKVT